MLTTVTLTTLMTNVLSSRFQLLFIDQFQRSSVSNDEVVCDPQQRIYTGWKLREQVGCAAPGAKGLDRAENSFQFIDESPKRKVSSTPDEQIVNAKKSRSHYKSLTTFPRL